MERDERIRPTPMRCKCVIPVEIPVNLLRKGTQMRSYKGTKVIKNTTGKIGMDAGGM